MAELRTNIIVRLVDQVTKPAKGISAVFRRFSADARVRGLKQSFKRVGARLGAVWKEAGRLSKGLLVVKAAIAGVTLVTLRLVRGTAQVGDEIAKTSRKLGIGVQELQGYRFAFEALAGVSKETTDMSLQRFTRRVAEAANGTGSARKALRHLGIDLRDANGRIRSAGDLLPEVADALSGVQDQALRVRIAFALFGSEGVSLVTALQQGAGPLREHLELSRQLGEFTEEQAHASEAFGDSLSYVQRSIVFIKHSVMLELMPALTEWLDRVRELVVANREIIVRRVLDWMRGFARAVRRLSSGIHTVVEAVGGWKWALRGLAFLVAGKLLVSIWLFGSAVWGLGKAIWQAIPAVLALSKALLTNPLILFGTAVIALISVIVLLRTEWFRASDTWHKVSEIIGGTIDALLRRFEGFRDRVTEAVQAIPRAVTEAVQGIPRAVTEAFEGLFGVLKAQLERIGDLVPDWLKGLLGNAGRGGSGMVGRIRGLIGPDSASGAPPSAAERLPLRQQPARTEVGGEVHIRIDSEGRPRVRRVERRGPVDLDVDAGLMTAGTG